MVYTIFPPFFSSLLCYCWFLVCFFFLLISLLLSVLVSCAAKWFRVGKDGTCSLLLICADTRGREYQKETLLSWTSFDWECKIWKYKASLKGSWKLGSLFVKYGRFLFACWILGAYESCWFFLAYLVRVDSCAVEQLNLLCRRVND